MQKFRKSLGLILVVVSLLALSVTPVIAATSTATVNVSATVDPTIGVTISAPTVAFTGLNPVAGQFDKANAYTVNVKSNATWGLAVQAAGDFSDGGVTPKTIPINKLSYRTAGVGTYTPFSTTAANLKSTQAPTGAAGNSTAYDLQLAVDYDAAAATYNTAINYTASN